MNFLDLIDEKKIAERKAALEAEWNTPDKVASRERAAQYTKDIHAKFERGKIALSIVREETGPHYSVTYFDASGKSYSREDVENAG